MDLKHLIDIYTTFPTAIFSLAFLILSFYWLTSLILGFDQDLGVEISNSGFFITLGLSKVPLCIGLTITSFIGLFISASIQEYFLLNIFNYFGLEINSYSIYYLLLTIPLFFVILATSMYLTGMILKPINHVFEIKKVN